MCAVRRVELLQDAADVHLDRAFLHLQPGGDQLIGLALAQKIDYRKLTRREVPSVRSPLPFTFRLVIPLCGCRAQRICRNKGATRADKPERSHHNFPFDDVGMYRRTPCARARLTSSTLSRSESTTVEASG